MPYKYIGGKEMAATALGPPCNLKFCQGIKTGGCQAIREEQKQWIFERVWSMETCKDPDEGPDEQAAAPPTQSRPKSGKHAKVQTNVTDFLKD